MPVPHFSRTKLVAVGPFIEDLMCPEPVPSTTPARSLPQRPKRHVSIPVTAVTYRGVMWPKGFRSH